MNTLECDSSETDLLMDMSDSPNLTDGNMDKKQKCQKCSAIFESFLEYYTHIQKCLRMTALGYNIHRRRSCHRCGQQFRYYYKYRNHLLRCWKSTKKGAPVASMNSGLDISSPEKEDESLKERRGNGNDTESTEKKSPKWTKQSCEKCGTTFKNALHQKVHMLSKTMCRTPPYTCRKCHKVFSSLHNVVKHERRKTNCLLAAAVKTKYQCEKCGMKFDYFSLYERHLKRIKSCMQVAQQDVVPTSSTVSVKMSRAALPVAKKVPVKKFHCACGRAFQYPSKLEQHLKRKIPCMALDPERRMELARSQPTNVAKNSANVVMDQKLLVKKERGLERVKDIQGRLTMTHRKTESIREKIIKKYQIMSTKSVDKLKSKSEANVSCMICKKEYFSAYNLGRHMKEKHDTVQTKQNEWPCPRCDRQFSSLSQLHRHQKRYKHWERRVSSRIRECYCPFCQKKFFYIGSRNNHIKIHSATQPKMCQEFLRATSCEICWKVFVDADEKNEHMALVHRASDQKDKEGNLETPQTSPVKTALSRDFSVASRSPTSSALLEKLRGSSSSRCGICKKLFCNPYVRNRHLICHLNVKLYKCHFCKEHFRRTDHLTYHLQQSHSSKLAFRCRKCGVKFLNHIQIAHHISRRHRNYNPSSLIQEIAGKTPIDSPLESPWSKLQTLKLDDHSHKKPPDQGSPVTLPPPKNNKMTSRTSTGASANKLTPNRPVEKLQQPVGRPPIPAGIKTTEYACAICKVVSFSKPSNLYRHLRSKQHKENAKLSAASGVSPPIYISQVSPEPDSMVVSAANSTSGVDANVEQGRKYHCNVCSIDFQTISTFVPHRLNHFHLQNVNPTDISEANPYSCEICSRMFGHHQKVQTHLLWHLRADKVEQVASHSPKSPPSSNLVNDQLPFLLFSPKSAPKDRNDKDEKIPSNSVARKSLGSPSKNIHVKESPLITSISPSGKPSIDHSSITPSIQRYCKFMCKCKKRFPNRKALRVHMRRCAERKKDSLRCSHCSLAFSSLNDMHYHEKSCLKVRGAEDDSISMSNGDQYDSVLYEPRSNSISEEPDECKSHCSDIEGSTNVESSESHNFLSKSASDKEGLPQNQHTSMSSEKAISDLDDLASQHWFHGESFLYENLDSKTSRIYQCLFCAKSFSSPTAMKDHLQMHAPFHCSKCNTVLNCLLDLFKHTCVKNKLNSGNKTAKFECRNFILHSQCKDSGSSGHKTVMDSSLLESAIPKALKAEEPEILSSLRKNFSHLLFLLVADPELMKKLGWGEKLIDNVLHDVLLHMGHEPYSQEPGEELECLRRNISLLLKACIKDQIMDAVESKDNKCIDEVVQNLLIQCCDGLDLPGDD